MGIAEIRQLHLLVHLLRISKVVVILVCTRQFRGPRALLKELSHKNTQEGVTHRSIQRVTEVAARR